MGGFCSKRKDSQKEGPVVSELTHAERQMARKGAGLAVVETSSKKKGNSLGDVLTTTTKKAKETVALTARKGAATVQRAGSLVRDSLDGIGSALTGGGGTYGSGIFTTGGEPKGKRVIGILAFEVASVIVKAMNIKVSLGEEDMEEFRQTVLNSAGVRTLVSDDETTVWKIAASDKRAELQVFISEVIRLGKLAEDPQWRQLERVFMRVGAAGGPGPKLNVQHLENELANLENLVATTGDLYHELHGLDSLQSNLKRRQDEEDAFPGSQRADTLPALRLELKQQEKEVKQLKKKSLWNRRLDQIVELLVDMVFYIHQQMVATFGPDVMIAVDKERRQGNNEDMWKLGVCGLALHYSNIVNTVDNMVSRPNSVAPNSRDSLYQMLPPKMKSAVRGRILGLKQEDDDEESATEIRGRLDEILDYIVPMAGNTIRYFSDKRLQGHSELQLLQTLHHADQRTTDAKLLELVVGLHYLISRAKGTQAKALTKSQILNQSNIQLPGLPLLGSHGGLAPGLQLPLPKSAFHHLNKQPHNIKNSAELGIHYPGGPLPNAPSSLPTSSSTGGSPLNPFLRSLNNSEGGSSLPSALLEQQQNNKTATTTTFSEEGVAVIPVPAPQGTAPVTVADALAKAAELADMDAVGGYRSDGSTASSSGRARERHHVQMPASTDLPATSGQGPEAPQTSEIQVREYEQHEDGSRAASAEVAPPAFEIGPGDEGPPGYDPWGKPHKGKGAENKKSLLLPEGAVTPEADWAVGPGFVSGSGKDPVAVVEVPISVESAPEPVDGIMRQKALSAGASPALSPSMSKKIGMTGSTWVSPRLLTSAMSLSKKRTTAPEEERSSGGESADETSPRGGMDRHRRFPSFSRNRGTEPPGVWTGSASGTSSGVSADISQISWPIGRPEVQRQGLSVRAAKMDAAMRREEIARGMFEGPAEQAPGIDISWPVGRPGGAVRVMSRAEASRLVTAGVGITGLPPSVPAPAPAPAPAAGWVPTPRPPGLPYEMSRSSSAPATGGRAYDGSQHGPPHVVAVPRSSSAVFDSGRSSQGTSPLIIQVPCTSGSAPELVQSISFGNVGSLNLVSVGGDGIVASADSLVMRPVNPASSTEAVNPASYELQWQALYGGGRTRGRPGDEDQWNRSEEYGPMTGVVVSPVPSSGDSGRPGVMEGGVFVFKSGQGEVGRGGVTHREHVFGAEPVMDTYTEDVGVAVSGLSSCDGMGSPNKRTNFDKVGSGASSFGSNRALNGEAEGFRIRGSGPRTATVVPQSADTKLRTEDLLPMLEMANKHHSKRDSFRQYYTWQQQASASDEALASTDIAQLTAMAKARGQPVPKGGSLSPLDTVPVSVTWHAGPRR